MKSHTYTVCATRRALTKKFLLGLGLGLGLCLPPGDSLAAGRPERRISSSVTADRWRRSPSPMKSYFEDEGLYVTLDRRRTGRCCNRVNDGELGAQYAGGPTAGATIGFGTKANVITAFSMDLNGNGVTVSNDVWEQMKPQLPQENGKPVHPIKADYLKPVIKQYRDEGKPFKMAMVFPVSTHNYELRYWLAAGGIHPGYYARSRVTSPNQIGADALLPSGHPASGAGTIDNCAWVNRGISRPFKGIGVPVITDTRSEEQSKVWRLQSGRTISEYPQGGSRADPRGHVAGLGRPQNRKEPQILSRPEYVGADYELLTNNMTRTFRQKRATRFGAVSTCRYNATYPISDAIWYLTQMRR
jgi:nitrate/nitrite transport system substrate-binding protein